MAEGTTTRRWPSAAKRATRRATSRMRSGLPMEVPPYFWTMSDTAGISVGISGKSRYSIVAPIESMDRPQRPQLIALAALALGAAATLIAWLATGWEAAREAEVEFGTRASRSAALVEQQVDRYLDVLYGVAALAYHDAFVSRGEFSRYASALDMPRRFPGIRAIEYIERVPLAKRDAFVARGREDRSL